MGPEGERVMATNSGRGFRHDAVDNRTHEKPADGQLERVRHRDGACFMDQKSSGQPFKGAAKEVDDRRT